MASATFLGTGNYLAPGGRYWNSFVLDRSILVEPSPTALPHLRRAGVPVDGLDAIAVSHFHPDHTFGWPFLLLEAAQKGRTAPLYVIGPPGIAAFLEDMMKLGAVGEVHAAAHSVLDIRYVEVDGGWQQAGTVRFRGIEVEHVPNLRCFGFLFDLGERTIGYSGDTQLCEGLEELARGADALVLECNSAHPWPGHMNVDSVRSLRATVPHVPFVLTHVDTDVDATGIDDVRIASDFETIEL